MAEYDQVERMSPIESNFRLTDKNKAEIEEHYASVSKIQAIISRNIDYHVNDLVSKDVALHLAENNNPNSSRKKLFTLDEKHGIMNLTPRGERFFLGLDCLDERIAEYTSEKTVRLHDDTPQKRDILSVDSATGFATLVGGDKTHTDHTLQNMYTSLSPTWDQPPIDASEAFAGSEPIMFDKFGRPTNDTHEFVLRSMNIANHRLSRVVPHEEIPINSDFSKLSNSGNLLRKD